MWLLCCTRWLFANLSSHSENGCLTGIASSFNLTPSFANSKLLEFSWAWQLWNCQCFFAWNSGRNLWAYISSEHITHPQGALHPLFLSFCFVWKDKVLLKNGWYANLKHGWKYFSHSFNQKNNGIMSNCEGLHEKGLVLNVHDLQTMWIWILCIVLDMH